MLAYADDARISKVEVDEAAGLMTLRGMAHFDMGDVIEALSTLGEAVETSRLCSQPDNLQQPLNSSFEKVISNRRPK